MSVVFWGLAYYYRRFLAGFSDIAAPLHALTRRGVVFQWNQEQQVCFDTLKERLTSAPMLGMPSGERTVIMDTDASQMGLGAVLSQEQESTERVIACASQSLSHQEQNYCMTRHEWLAVKLGLR